MSNEPWPEETVRRLEPLIWRAYCIHGDIAFRRPFPVPKPFPTRRADLDRLEAASARYFIEEVHIILEAEPDARLWSGRDRGDAIAIMREARGIAEDLYEKNCNAKPKEMMAKLPGLSFRLCDAALAYLGATRH